MHFERRMYDVKLAQRNKNSGCSPSLLCRFLSSVSRCFPKIRFPRRTLICSNTSCSHFYEYIPISFFNVHGSVLRKNILIYVQQDATLHSLFYLETALHVSGGTSTLHQERIQLYLQHLVFLTFLLLPPASGR